MSLTCPSTGDVLDSDRSAALDTAPGPPPPNAVDVDPEFVRQGLKDLMQQVNRIERQRVRGLRTARGVCCWFKSYQSTLPNVL